MSRSVFSMLAVLAAAAVYFASPSVLSAQDKDYAIEVMAGKKVIYIDKLNLPPNTPLSTILDMFPELLVRGTDYRLENYDLQVAGVSYGKGKETMEVHLMAGEIQKVEVSLNPSTSEQKNGQGGVIKVTLKDYPEGVSGSALLSASSSVDVMPGARINYQKGHWLLRSSLMMDYYHPLNEITRREKKTSSLSSYQTDTIAINDAYEMLTFDAEYKPRKGTKLHMWVAESFSSVSKVRNSHVENNSSGKRESSLEKDNVFSYRAGVKYETDDGHNKVQTELVANGSPQKYSLNKFDDNAVSPVNYWKYDESQSSVTLSGLGKYIRHLVVGKPGYKADLTGGMNFSYTPKRFAYSFESTPSNDIISGPLTDANHRAHGNILYLSPFLESDNVFGNWYFKAGVRYQHYRVNIDSEGNDSYSRPSDHMTAFTNIGWQIAPHHHLSMIIDRSIRRPNESNVYPYLAYSPQDETFIKGNPDLLATSLHTVSMEYITDFRAGERAFTFNMGARYTNSDRIIKQDRTSQYITWLNDGNGNLGCADFMFLYSHNVFTMSLEANLFDNFKSIGSKENRYKYFNLSVMPTIAFGNGWGASVQVAYNSAVITSNSRLGDYLYAWTRFTKTLDKWTVFLMMDDCMHQLCEDRFYGKTISDFKYYNLHHPGINLGAYIKF